MAVVFETLDVDFKLPQQLLYKRWLKRVIEKEKKKAGDLHFVFMSDEALLERNRQFLNHDYFTDIITFDYTEDNNVSGDILISIDRVQDNAKRFGVDFQAELKRVIVHGVLHLCGYKDKTKSDKETMRAVEEKYIKIFGKP